jgi:hypothetical protein
MGSAAVLGAIIALLTATYVFDDVDPLGRSTSLKEMVAPNGLDLTKLIGLWKEGKVPINVAEALLDYVTEVARLKDDVTIKLAGGNETTISEAKDAYKDLFKRWTLSEGSEYNAVARCDGRPVGYVSRMVRSATGDPPECQLRRSGPHAHGRRRRRRLAGELSQQRL